MIFRSQDSYSTFVSWAKVGLYVGALMLLSTLFLFSSRVDVTDSVIYSDLDVDDIIRNQRLSQPEISTTLDDGTGIRVTAASARPDAERSDLVVLTQIDALVSDPGGQRLTIMAGTGSVDQQQQRIEFAESVTLSAGDDVIATSDAMRFDIQAAQVTSGGAVAVTGPFGRFDAGQMTAQRSADNFVLTFTDGVRLVYTPPKTE